MARPSVEFHADARAEYVAAIEWYRKRSPRAARNFEAEFSQAIEQIRKSPESWSVYVKGASYCTSFPSRLCIKSSADIIFILAVAHTHRTPGYWRARL